MIKKIRLIVTILFCIMLFACSTFRRVPIPGKLNGWPYELPPMLINNQTEKNAMIEKTICFLEENNNAYWGTLTEAERADYMRLHEELCVDIERMCVSFINLDLDWNALKTETGAKLASAESHGAAMGALTRLSYYLKEAHTIIIPDRLMMNNSLNSGAPCIALSGVNVNPLGAFVTPCNDDRLVISKVFDNSAPYSWEVGDEILALNGIPWQEWRKPLELSSLPVIGSAGANETAIDLNWQKSIMRNIHLFKTVTIRRKTGGRTELVKIPNRKFVACEKYREAPFRYRFVPGSEVAENYDILEGGILQDGNIGYIRIDYFDQEIGKLEKWDPSQTRFYKEFQKAVTSLLDTEGIILDLRNHGGGMHQVSYGGLELLVANPNDVQFYDVYQKTGSAEYTRYPLLERKFPGQNPDTFFKKKIVVLSGSECVSGGDIFTAIASEFPEITVMGTANNGSLAGYMNDKIYKQGEIKVFTMLPGLIWYSHNTDSADLRKSFVEYYVEYDADDIAVSKDTLLEEALAFMIK